MLYKADFGIKLCNKTEKNTFWVLGYVVLVSSVLESKPRKTCNEYDSVLSSFC